MLCCSDLNTKQVPRVSRTINFRRFAVAFGIVCEPIASHAAGGGALEIFPDDRLLIQLVVFAVLVLPIHRILFAPVMRILKERSEQIEGVRERAADLAQKADSAYNKYQQTVADERGRSELDRRERVDLARAERAEVSGSARLRAEERLGTAREDIAQVLEEARAQLKREAPTVARDAASGILGRELR